MTRKGQQELFAWVPLIIALLLTIPVVGVYAYQQMTAQLADFGVTALMLSGTLGGYAFGGLPGAGVGLLATTAYEYFSGSGGGGTGMNAELGAVLSSESDLRGTSVLPNQVQKSEYNKIFDVKKRVQAYLYCTATSVGCVSIPELTDIVRDIFPNKDFRLIISYQSTEIRITNQGPFNPEAGPTEFQLKIAMPGGEPAHLKLFMEGSPGVMRWD